MSFDKVYKKCSEKVMRKFERSQRRISLNVTYMGLEDI
jgi:hypothetical protein